MERTDRIKDTVLLLDNFSESSRCLYESLTAAGFGGMTLVLEDDGFLPEGVVSVSRYFCGDMTRGERIPGRPRYFNQIEVPDYWEISGNGSYGNVHDLYHERARIHYAEPRWKRLVSSVEWLDERGMVRLQEHYDNRGALYARTVFTKDGLRFSKTYFDAQEREVLVENHMTGDLILNRAGRVHIFHGKVDLTEFLLQELGLAESRLLFNSLGTPFFVAERLPKNGKQDVLFWQEGVRPDIPGNMQFILDGNSKRTGRILVQKKASWEKLIELGASPEPVRPLGFIYPFTQENTGAAEALICTNSDRIRDLRELVEALPQLHFHVAAITEMSARLMDLERYDNVSLYPAVHTEVLEELFDKCAYYLDINYESEIVSAVKTAFLHNQLVLGFNDTLHNRDYIASPHIFDNRFDLTSALYSLTSDPALLADRLAVQREAALSETKERYWEEL